MIKCFSFRCTQNEGLTVSFIETDLPNTFAITINDKSVFLTKKDAEDIRDILSNPYSTYGSRISFVTEEDESST